MTWRTDIQNAPRSYYKHTPFLDQDGAPKINQDGTQSYYREFVKKVVWVDFGDGQKCGTSYWCPDDKRWCGANKGKEIAAFIELPLYRNQL